MLAAERQAQIRGEVIRNGVVRVGQLAVRFGVSEMTIRRDLDELEHNGVVVKVHGGATLPATAGAPSTDEPGFEANATRQRAEKQAIARAAAALVEPGMAVAVSAGTTTWALAHDLRSLDRLTVVTNSIRVAEVLHAADTVDREVVLTGGVRTPSDALVGPVAVASMRRLHVDVAFLGVHGIAERPGFTTPNLLEAEADRAMVEAGRRLVVVADSTKWGTVGLSTIAALDEAAVVVTDTGLPTAAREALADHVGELILVDPDQKDEER